MSIRIEREHTFGSLLRASDGTSVLYTFAPRSEPALRLSGRLVEHRQVGDRGGAFRRCLRLTWTRGARCHAVGAARPTGCLAVASPGTPMYRANRDRGGTRCPGPSLSRAVGRPSTRS